MRRIYELLHRAKAKNMYDQPKGANELVQGGVVQSVVAHPALECRVGPWVGLVQPQDKIVDRCAITIYPYSLCPIW